MQSIKKFFLNFFDNYLEVIKVYQCKKDAFEKEDIKKMQKITGYLFLQILSYFAPFIPFNHKDLYYTYYDNINSIHAPKYDKKEYFLKEILSNKNIQYLF